MATATDSPENLARAIEAAHRLLADSERIGAGKKCGFDELEYYIKTWEHREGHANCAEEMPVLHTQDTELSCFFRFVLALARYGQAIEQMYQFCLGLRRQEYLNKHAIPIRILYMDERFWAPNEDAIVFPNQPKRMRSSLTVTEEDIDDIYDELKLERPDAERKQFVHPEVQLAYHLATTRRSNSSTVIGYPSLPCGCCGDLLR